MTRRAAAPTLARRRCRLRGVPRRHCRRWARRGRPSRQRRPGVASPAAGATAVRERVRRAGPSAVAAATGATDCSGSRTGSATSTSTTTTTRIPTLEKFTEETGITVNYLEAIDGNESSSRRACRAARGRPADRVGPRRRSPTGWSPGSSASAGWRRSTGHDAELRRRTCSTATTAARSTRTRTSPRRGSRA